jgi:hypothetical protein
MQRLPLLTLHLHFAYRYTDVRTQSDTYTHLYACKTHAINHTHTHANTPQNLQVVKAKPATPFLPSHWFAWTAIAVTSLIATLCAPSTLGPQMALPFNLAATLLGFLLGNALPKIVQVRENGNGLSWVHENWSLTRARHCRATYRCKV